MRNSLQRSRHTHTESNRVGFFIWLLSLCIPFSRMCLCVSFLCVCEWLCRSLPRWSTEIVSVCYWRTIKRALIRFRRLRDGRHFRGVGLASQSSAECYDMPEIQIVQSVEFMFCNVTRAKLLAKDGHADVDAATTSTTA